MFFFSPNLCQMRAVRVITCSQYIFYIYGRKKEKHLDLQMSSPIFRNARNREGKNFMFILKVESLDQKEQLNYKYIIYLYNIAWQCNVYKTILLNNLAP